MAVYYRFYDTEEETYLGTGYNGTIESGVRNEIIEFLDSADGYETFENASIESICNYTGWLKCEKRLGLPFPAPTEERIEEICSFLYKSHGGYSIVLDHINEQQEKNNPVYKNVKWNHCKGCESEMPSLHGGCLVCGGEVDEINIKNNDILIQAVCTVMKDDMKFGDYSAISEMFEQILDGADPKDTLMGYLPESVVEDIIEGRFKTIW